MFKAVCDGLLLFQFFFCPLLVKIKIFISDSKQLDVVKFDRTFSFWPLPSCVTVWVEEQKNNACKFTLLLILSSWSEGEKKVFR